MDFQMRIGVQNWVEMEWTNVVDQPLMAHFAYALADFSHKIENAEVDDVDVAD